jgi:hypothetical protein
MTLDDIDAYNAEVEAYNAKVEAFNAARRKTLPRSRRKADKQKSSSGLTPAQAFAEGQEILKELQK